MNYLIKVAAGIVVSWAVQAYVIPYLQAKIESLELDEAWDVFNE